MEFYLLIVGLGLPALIVTIWALEDQAPWNRD